MEPAVSIETGQLDALAVVLLALVLFFILAGRVIDWMKASGYLEYRNDDADGDRP